MPVGADGVALVEVVAVAGVDAALERRVVAARTPAIRTAPNTPPRRTKRMLRGIFFGPVLDFGRIVASGEFLNVQLSFKEQLESTVSVAHFHFRTDAVAVVDR